MYTNPLMPTGKGCCRIINFLKFVGMRKLAALTSPICLKMTYARSFRYLIINAINRSGKFAAIAFRRASEARPLALHISMPVPANGAMMCQRLALKPNKGASGAAGTIFGNGATP